MPAYLKKLHDRENGFTLVELLIVVLIIGVLAAIAIPVYLGIQQQAYKSAIRADVNQGVKRVQVALTEGKGIAEVKANYADYLKTSVRGESVYPGNSPTAGAGANDFTITGTSSTSGSPAGPINYTYAYDSVTGKFTEADSGSTVPTLAISTTSLPDAVKDSAYSAQVAVTATNTTGTTQYSATGLPGTGGWAIDPNTGVITGTPSTTGTIANITVTATNGSLTATRTYSITVNAKPAITTPSLPNGVVGTAYTQTITASGTPAPTFAYTGNLPTGLTLLPSGAFSGTPTTTGTFTFSVTATNSAGTSAAQAYTVVVNAKPSITTASLLSAVQNSSGYSQFVASSATPSATYSATGLPTGMNINTNTGEITGDAGTSATTYTVNVTATNTAGSDSKQLNLVVNPNVLNNASFESGSTSWTFNPSGPAVVSSTGCTGGTTLLPYSGSKYLLFYSGDAGSGQYKTFLQDAPLTVTAGKTYSGGMWLNGCSQAGQAGTLYFSTYDASGNVTVIKQLPYTTTSGWTYVGVSNVPATVNGVGLRLQYVSTNGYGNIAFDYANAGAAG